jgi:hypothetical protein
MRGTFALVVTPLLISSMRSSTPEGIILGPVSLVLIPSSCLLVRLAWPIHRHEESTIRLTATDFRLFRKATKAGLRLPCRMRQRSL